MWKQGLIGVCTLIAFTVPGDAAEKTSGAKSDLPFSHEIAMHHQMGIEMAQLCQKKAEHGELKAFCSKATSEMQSDSQKLSVLAEATAKSGTSPRKSSSAGSSGSSSMKMDMSSMSPEMRAIHDQHQKSMQDLQGATGSDFDRRFVADMARHHQDGIGKFEECQARASSSDLKALCGKMVAAQQQETKQLRQWQTAWGGQSAR